MNNKITVLILCFTLSLSACQKSNESIETQPKSENKNINDSTTKPQNSASAIDTKIDCDNTTLDQWFGFDESQLEDAKCLQLKKFNTKLMKCEKESNAFGADFDGIRFESKDESIFAYPSKQLCETAKGIWESNGP